VFPGEGKEKEIMEVQQIFLRSSNICTEIKDVDDDRRYSQWTRPHISHHSWLPGFIYDQNAKSYMPCRRDRQRQRPRDVCSWMSCLLNKRLGQNPLLFQTIVPLAN
jgi:hypothetical protein